MVFGLVGVLFAIVTFPGIIVTSVIQNYFVERYDVPMRPEGDGIPDDVDDLGELSDDELAAAFGIDPDELPTEADSDGRTNGFGTADEDGGFGNGFEATTGHGDDPDNRFGRASREGDESESTEADEKAPDPDDVEWTVDYENVGSYSAALSLTVTPFLVASAIALIGYVVLAFLFKQGTNLWYVVFWLAFSVGAHAFPSNEATEALWRLSRESSSPLRVIGYPVVGISKLIDTLEYLWLDAIYSIALYFLVVSVAFPSAPGAP